MKIINLVLFCCLCLGLQGQQLNVKKAITELNLLLPSLNSNSNNNSVKSQSSISLKRDGIMSFFTVNSKEGNTYDKTEINIHHRDIDVNRLNLKTIPCCKMLEIYCRDNNFNCVKYIDRTSNVAKPIPYILLGKDDEINQKVMLALKEIINTLNKRSHYVSFSTPPSKHIVQLYDNGGVYFVNIEINNRPVRALLDSGASVVAVSKVIERQLLKDKVIRRSDYIEPAKYRIATGRIIKAKRFILPEMKVGKLTVKNVVCSVVDEKTPLLLGKSFLDLFSKWSIDNEKQTLTLEQ